MIITVLKTTFKKAKPREIIYRSYKNYNEVMFREGLNQRLACSKNHTEFRDGFLDVLNTHLPLKKKLVRANEVPYMTKALRRAIANRSRLENQYYKYNPLRGCISIKQMKGSGCTKSKRISAAGFTKRNVKSTTQIWISRKLLIARNFGELQNLSFQIKGQVKLISY